jgi:hypothetical protein
MLGVSWQAVLSIVRSRETSVVPSGINTEIFPIFIGFCTIYSLTTRYGADETRSVLVVPVSEANELEHFVRHLQSHFRHRQFSFYYLKLE